MKPLTTPTHTWISTHWWVKPHIGLTRTRAWATWTHWIWTTHLTHHVIHVLVHLRHIFAVFRRGWPVAWHVQRVWLLILLLRMWLILHLHHHLRIHRSHVVPHHTIIHIHLVWPTHWAHWAHVVAHLLHSLLLHHHLLMMLLIHHGTDTGGGHLTSGSHALSGHHWHVSTHGTMLSRGYSHTL